MTGVGWYVIEEPHRDPAHVQAGPMKCDEADKHRSVFTHQGTIMHTPALVNAIHNQGYNVTWSDQAKKPDALCEEYQ